MSDRIGPFEGPVRRVVRRSHSAKVGPFPSTKSKTPLAFEGSLERDFLKRAEADASITRIAHQPCKIWWDDDDGVEHWHIPDFDIDRYGNRFIVEVKPADQVALFEARTKKVKALLAKRGIGYLVMDERVIRRQPDLANAEIVICGLGYEPSPAQRANILRIAHEKPGIALGEICAALMEDPCFCHVVLSMVIARDLSLVVDDGETIDGHLAARVRMNGNILPW